MSYIYTILSLQYNGFSYIFLDIISLLSVFFGIYVISSKNPIVSVLFLIGLFLSISINLILLGHNFLGLSYLLVYVGAVSILFLFILMLINVRISELLNDTSNSIPLAIFTGFFLGFPLYEIFNKEITNNVFNNTLSKNKAKDFTNNTSSITNYNNDNIENNLKIEKDILNFNDYTSNIHNDIIERTAKDNLEYVNLKNDDLSYALSNTWDNNLVEFTDISSVGNNLYTTYSIWLIISSIILLLAMIGAITITKKDY